MTISRRDLLKIGAGAGAALALNRTPVAARTMASIQTSLLTRPIPSSGEELPVIGLGSWRTFDVDADAEEAAGPREVLRLFQRLGGTVVDTAPAYGRSERFVGAASRALGIGDGLFMATKVNVEGRGRAAAVEQMENSSRVLGRRTIDLMQVWNLGDSFRSLSDRHLAEHMEAVHAWKAEGRARYVGITTSFPRQYDAVEAALTRHEMDFVQLDYSIADRVPEERLLPLARERGIAVLVNRPFGSGSFFSTVSGAALPSFASEIGCETWAQFALKFIVSHPAVTCAIPATSDPDHLQDNMGACRGALPDASLRARMVAAFEAI